MIFQIWIVHFSILLIVFILIIVGVLIARLLKGKKKWFFTAHKILEVIAVILAIIAVLITGFNFTVGPHAYVGVIIIIGLIIVLLGGIVYTKIKPSTEDLIEQKKRMRMIHTILGIIVIILIFISLMNILTFL